MAGVTGARHPCAVAGTGVYGNDSSATGAASGVLQQRLRKCATTIRATQVRAGDEAFVKKAHRISKLGEAYSRSTLAARFSEKV